MGGSGAEDPIVLALKPLQLSLNKLAKNNLEKIAVQLIGELSKYSKSEDGEMEVLSGFLDILYDKALEESKFSHIYAELCSRIKRDPALTGINFMDRLASRAQQVFKTIADANVGSHANYTEEERNNLVKLRYLGSKCLSNEKVKTDSFGRYQVHLPALRKVPFECECAFVLRKRLVKPF